MSRLSRAGILCKIALAVAAGLPAPKAIRLVEHVSIDLDGFEEFNRWHAFLGGEPFSEVGSPDDRFRAGHARDWHGWPFHFSARQDGGAGPDNDVATITAFADGEQQAASTEDGGSDE